MAGQPSTLFARGLSESEAARRLAIEGPNELPRQRRRTLPLIFLDVMREPMLALLVVGAAIYLLLGDVHEALVLLAFACLSILITVVQQSRTERALEALRDLASPRALVIRDGERKRIPGREVVRGDLVLLAEGDRVAADGVLIENQGIQADESLLTGESVPVGKQVAEGRAIAAMERPGGDGGPFLFGGSLIVRGTGLCHVIATGARSEMGRIGGALAGIQEEVPRLRAQTRRLTGWMALAGGGASLLCVLLYGLTRGDWLDAALAGIALGMSMLPEEFPVVLTVFMAMGAVRMARVRVLARRPATIETLGAATVLCTDKTGTLTENRMRVAQLRLPDGRAIGLGGGPVALTEEFQPLAELGILASAQQPIDPMEQAFHALAIPEPVAGRKLVRQYALDPHLLAMSQVWTAHAAADSFVAAKGAPEAICELCRMDDGQKAALREQADAMAAKGYRVLALADARCPGLEALPDTQRGFAFSFRGLAGLADPIRASVPDAVRECRAAGIRVVMITGDYPQTARAIAEQAGIDARHVLSGEQLATMTDQDLAGRVGSTTVFARVMPEQKLRIVNALKASGEIVAMTGDGVNDAPSLKAAHIGIAMGGRGSDVAREASSLVLLDDDFGSIVNAIRLGRRIYDNLRKAMAFIIAVHIPIAALALMPLFTGMPLLLVPIHIAFVEMIIDPVCSLAFEAETDESDVMERPPRAPDAPLFSRWLVGWAAVQGLMTALLVAGIALYLREGGQPIDAVRAGSFLALLLGILGLILVNKAFSASLFVALRRPNPTLSVVVGIVALIFSGSLAIRPLADIFRFAAPDAGDLLLVLVAALATLGTLETIKPLWRLRLTA